MEVYVIEEPDVPTTDPTYKAVCQVIGHQATELHKEFVERGAQEGISPHFDLMDIAAQLLNFREGQKGFEKISAELRRCAEDPRFEKIYDKFIGYDDTSEQPTEGSHHLPGQADDQLPDAPQP